MFALPAVALPVIIHLFTRTKVKKVRFSTLTFLKELQQQKIRSVKIRQILLLIIRTLIVLLLVLAFARPTLQGNFAAGIGTRVKTSAAIILDNSVSMARMVNGKSLFERARERALTTLDVFKPGDQVFLIFPTATQPDEPRGYHDLNLLRRWISTSPLSYQMTDLNAAIQQAQLALSQSHNMNREIYLISDLQATGFPTLMDSAVAAVSKDYPIFVFDPGKDRFRNLAISEVALKSQIIERGKVIELTVKVLNQGMVPEANRLVQLFIDGKRTAQSALSLAPGQTTQADFRFTLDTSGLHNGYVALEDDDLPQDNRRDFCLQVPGEIKILLIGNHPFELSNIELALAPGARFSHFNLERIKISELTADKVGQAKVIFLVNVPEIAPLAVNLLADFVEKGGGLVMIPGDNLNLRQYNDGLGAKFNLPRFGETMGLRADPDAAFGIDKVDFSHPIFYGMFQAKEQQRFESPQIYFAIKVKPGSHSQSIIQYSDGHPFLIESRIGSGSVLMYTTGIQDEWSDFAQKTIFAPLIHRSVAYLASLYAEKPIALLVGEPIKYKFSELLRDEIEMVRPNQARIKINPITMGDQYFIEYSETDIPGIYNAQRSEQVLAQWAVNLDPRESEVTPIEFDRLQRLYNAKKISRSEPIANFVEKQRYGRELWKYLAFLALALMIIEMFIYREKGEVTGSVK